MKFSFKCSCTSNCISTINIIHLSNFTACYHGKKIAAENRKPHKQIIAKKFIENTIKIIYCQTLPTKLIQVLYKLLMTYKL